MMSCLQSFVQKMNTSRVDIHKDNRFIVVGRLHVCTKSVLYRNLYQTDIKDGKHKPVDLSRPTGSSLI